MENQKVNKNPPSFLSFAEYQSSVVSNRRAITIKNAQLIYAEFDLMILALFDSNIVRHKLFLTWVAALYNIHLESGSLLSLYDK
uniref:Uncharacterized protein n=1 Tax=Onchocerca volvulus TaxID=6282 RepID=A0A8R1XWR4_ONCVO